VLCDVFNEIVLLATSVVRSWILAILGKPENSGESPNVKLRRNIVSSGVHLDNLHILLLHGLTQLVIDGGQLLTVATPGSVELNQHVLLTLGDELLEVLGDGNLDVVGRVIRDGL